jgi:peptide/nickel transport system substrate-binding protein
MVAAVGALLVTACSGPSENAASSAPAAMASPEQSSAGQPGGTIRILSSANGLASLDPQVVYNGEDFAFLGATITRTLTAYAISADRIEGTSLVPDMATDTGRASNQFTKWEFTLRDGITWQDGTPVTCADVKYGTSRTFDVGISQGGPTYAVTYLDIPTAEDGSSEYQGPTTGKGQALFDKAVTCSADNRTIAFNLNQSVTDFNDVVTLQEFAAVPTSITAGDDYSPNVQSNGPYMIQTYETGPGGKLALVRNPNWSKASDPYRSALPDSWVMEFGIEKSAIDQRVVQDSGDDQYALTLNLPSALIPPEFNDPALASRRVNMYDPFLRYTAVNAQLLPDIKVRQAIGVALDREALRQYSGGEFAGDLADGVVTPNIGIDYAPTGLWEGLLGQPVPPSGDPEFARKLLAEAGVKDLTITLDYSQSQEDDPVAAIYVESLKRAGIKVKLNPIEPGQYYGSIIEGGNELMIGGWGPDWSNASSVIPRLLTVAGGWDLSQVDDKAFNAKVGAALVEPDRSVQATMWQQLNTEAARNMWVIPTLFEKEQRLAGSKVGPLYITPSYGAWPYAAMYAVR